MYVYTTCTYYLIHNIPEVSDKPFWIWKNMRNTIIQQHGRLASSASRSRTLDSSNKHVWVLHVWVLHVWVLHVWVLQYKNISCYMYTCRHARSCRPNVPSFANHAAYDSPGSMASTRVKSTIMHILMNRFLERVKQYIIYLHARVGSPRTCHSIHLIMDVSDQTWMYMTVCTEQLCTVNT